MKKFVIKITQGFFNKSNFSLVDYITFFSLPSPLMITFIFFHYNCLSFPKHYNFLSSSLTNNFRFPHINEPVTSDGICTSLIALLAGLRIHWLHPLQRDKTSSKKKRHPGYDTKLYLMVRLQFWRFGECGVLFHYHYYQVHSYLEW